MGDGRSKPARADELPRWREGLGVGLVSPKAMNNKAQGRRTLGPGQMPTTKPQLRQPWAAANEVLQRMCAIALHTMECRFVVQPLCGWKCVMRTCTQGALKRPWALLCNRFAVGNA